MSANGPPRITLESIVVHDATYLPCPFWRKANNFRGLFVFLLYDVATINMAYIEIFLDYILYMC
jgi:hypothetical protein